MIIGLGNDVIELSRIQAAIMGHADAFLRRVLSPDERTIASAYRGARLIEFVAGRFAAKEAIAKATGLGLGRLGMSTVTIELGDRGLDVRFAATSGLTVLQADDALLVSISHTATMAFAVAILERNSPA